MTFAKRTAVGLVLGLLVATIASVGSSSAATTSWSCFKPKASERAFTEKMNKARTSRGLGKVTLDKQMSRVARKHSAEMAEKQSVFHSSRTKLGQKITRWRLLAENVGRGGTVARTHKGFMASPGHRYNILYPSFTYVGVGTVKRNGIIYVSVVFESSRDPGTTLSPPSC